MIIKIALGILLGFILLGVLILVVCVLSAGIVRAQDRINEMKPIIPRLRPEADNYRRMQEIKKRAKDAHPEHWRDRNDG